MPEQTDHPNTIAVLGATGYIGGRLVPRLLERGYRVRAIARSAYKLQCRPWGQHKNLEIAAADVLDRDSLKKALTGVRVAYYLVHSMQPDQSDFAEADRTAAQNMAELAEELGLERILYLGGLGDEADPELSHHLRSRIETGHILERGQVPVTCFRAAMILGSGSASFEIMRYLVDRLPIMLTPSWVRTLSQPIAVRDVLGYLEGALECPETTGQTFDIGGPDVLSYEEIFHIYAKEAGLHKRLIIPVPFFSPTLSSLWIHIITPVPASLARPLAKGLRSTVVCEDTRIRELLPRQLLTVQQAIHFALERIRQHKVESCWMDAGELQPPEWISCGDAHYAGGTILESNHRVRLACAPDKVWKTVKSIGGERGWYYGEVLWKLRGLADRLIGGVGLRRGRRDPEELLPGDVLDFWRVTVVEENSRLQLLAEMKLPGEAMLQFSITPQIDGNTELSQIARFLPRGLWGMLYWYSLYPLHGWLFSGMLGKIAELTGCEILSGPESFTQSASMCTLPFVPETQQHEQPQTQPLKGER